MFAPRGRAYNIHAASTFCAARHEPHAPQAQNRFLRFCHGLFRPETKRPPTSILNLEDAMAHLGGLGAGRNVDGGEQARRLVSAIAAHTRADCPWSPMDRSTAVRLHTCPSLSRVRDSCHFSPPRAADRGHCRSDCRTTNRPEQWEGLWPRRVLGRASPHPRILPPLRDSREDRASPSCRGPACQADGLETRIYQSRPGPATLTHDPFGSGWKGPFPRVYHQPVRFLFLVSCFSSPPSCDLNSQFALNVPRPLPR